MKKMLIGMALAVIVASSPALPQTGTEEKEVRQIREKMALSFSEAVKSKDAARTAERYSEDVVLSALAPTPRVVTGRAAVRNWYEDLFKAGFVEYSGKPDQVHLIRDGLAWSTGTYTITVAGRQVRGHWLDQFQREGDGEWRVTFEAVAAVP
jgi:uncharacterized protein (TIGR02246 family)